MSRSAGSVTDWTDAYFNRTKATVARFGDVPVTYAVFMRRPVVTAPRLAIDWLTEIGRERGVEYNIELCHEEGKWVWAGETLVYTSCLLYTSDAAADLH